MLSTFNLPGKNISMEKQMSMMRTYLSELKDDIEKELYDIKWENLAKSLQDKISSLESYRDDSELRINTINAKYVDTDYLTANYITAQQISTNYASIGSLNAVSAAVGDLAAIAITTQNLSAQTIQGSQITGLTINANQITAGRIKANQLDANDIATNAFITTDLHVERLHTIDLYAGCPDVLGGVYLTPRWQYDSSLNRYMLVSLETGQFG